MTSSFLHKQVRTVITTMESLRQSSLELAGWATNPDVLCIELSMCFLILQICRPTVHNLCVRLPLAKLNSLRATHPNTLAFLSAASLSEFEARARGGAECWLEYWSLQLDRFVIFLGSFEDDRVLRGHRAPTESTSSLQPAARTGTPTASTTSATSSDSNQQRQRARRLPYQPAVILVRCNCTCFNALPQALASLRMPMNTYYV